MIRIENVYCVGKNYFEHIKEFEPNNSEIKMPDEPIIFLKPNTSVNSIEGMVRIPEWNGHKISKDLQNEVELVVIISKDGVNLSEKEVDDHIFGYAAGIDFTLRDVQSRLKNKGLPWALSKGFFSAASVSKAVSKDLVSDVNNLTIKLKVNDDLKQDANTSEMIFGVNYIVRYISSIFGLRKGDIIFTGTPKGVTTLKEGDVVEAFIENIGVMKINVR